MDLLDFQGEALYFDEGLDPAVTALLAQASRDYGDGGAERPLQQAYRAAPESLAVLVALYRFYYYQHRLDDAWRIAEAALAVSGARLDLPRDWRELDRDYIGLAAQRSMTLLRFHLLALKASAYLRLRLGQGDEGEALLEKLAQLDDHDRLGAGALLQVIRQSRGLTVVET
ncbi:hypothetical protein [Methylogaea oryzae]|uniref:Uncharacterized protein n=1 Tax=Methylogaea oryzae TaxID=1295382 RepID=A0A8D5ANG6_9GAMM|nr:hypothetical protein [Methylogaea oryzae]BBL72075.1 hypothetical protein MoryE10_26810 [Methylogaea oryzae]